MLGAKRKVKRLWQCHWCDSCTPVNLITHMNSCVFPCACILHSYICSLHVVKITALCGASGLSTQGAQLWPHPEHRAGSDKNLIPAPRSSLPIPRCARGAVPPPHSLESMGDSPDTSQLQGGCSAPPAARGKAASTPKRLPPGALSFFSSPVLNFNRISL